MDGWSLAESEVRVCALAALLETRRPVAMMQDARKVEDGAVLEFDLCIVGGGAAGITIARRFIGGRHRVALLEAGGLEYDADTQAIYQGVNRGQPYFDLDVSRLRFFGGTTNHWDGRCRPLDPLDFEVRPWVPKSGWPIDRATLDPYYVRAQEVCQLGPFRYDPEWWLRPDEMILPLDPAKLITGLWQYSPPTRFGEVYRAELKEAANVEVLLDASMVDIETDAGGRQVRQLTVATLAGQRFTLRADRFVLACGGLENARLLLAANRQMNVGLGNQNDNVGRYFMEHPHMAAAKALLGDARLAEFYDYENRDDRRGGVGALGNLGPSPDWQAEAGLLACDFNLTVDNIGQSGFAALRRIWNAIERGRMPDPLLDDLGIAVFDIDDTIAGLLGRFQIRPYRPDHAGFILWAAAEQAPNPDSRVTLGTEVDAFGMPRIEVDWRLTELDKRSVQQVHQMIASELGRTGLGRLEIEEWLTADTTSWSEDVSGGYHHMGTTRMSDLPADGVVDRNARVHGLANLFIAGSSVFPTSGAANPTLTIVALSLRLADHLERIMVAKA